MAKCKFCGEDIPQKELFAHFNTKHTEEMRAIRTEAGKKPKKKTPATEAPEKAATPKKADYTLDPVQAAIMEFVGEKLQLPMTPALIYGYFCAKKMGFDGNVAQFLSDVIDDFFQARGINYYNEVMKWGIGETTIREGLGAATQESPLATGTGAR